MINITDFHHSFALYYHAGITNFSLWNNILLDFNYHLSIYPEPSLFATPLLPVVWSLIDTSLSFWYLGYFLLPTGYVPVSSTYIISTSYLLSPNYLLLLLINFHTAYSYSLPWGKNSQEINEWSVASFFQSSKEDKLKASYSANSMTNMCRKPTNFNEQNNNIEDWTTSN